MRLRALLTASVEQGIIGEAEKNKILDLGKSHTKPWISTLIDVLTAVLLVSSLIMLLELFDLDHVLFISVSAGYLIASQVALRLLSTDWLSLHAISAISAGALALGVTKIVDFSGPDINELGFMIGTLGTLLSLILSLRTNQDILLRFAFSVNIFSSLGTFLIVVTPMRELYCFSLASITILLVSLYTRASILNNSMQLVGVGSTIIFVSLCVTLLSVHLSLLCWIGIILLSVGLRYAPAGSHRHLPSLFISWGVVFLIVTVINATSGLKGFEIVLPFILVLLAVALYAFQKILIRKLDHH